MPAERVLTPTDTPREPTAAPLLILRAAVLIAASAAGVVLVAFVVYLSVVTGVGLAR